MKSQYIVEILIEAGWSKKSWGHKNLDMAVIVAESLRHGRKARVILDGRVVWESGE